MPTTKVDHTNPTVASGLPSPVVLTIEPHSAPLTLVITSASNITVTGTAPQGKPVDVTR
jgi:hypothetical protein